MLITKLGKTFTVKDRTDLFWESVARNKWENPTFRIFQQFIRPGSVYLDIGSWIGPTVLFGSNISRHCFAVEPDPIAFAELKANIELNPTLEKKITLFNGCIAEKTGRVQFGNESSFGNSTSSLLFGNKTCSVEVEALSFEDFLHRYAIKECGFIKMDIEGGETMVLPTMKTFLNAQMPAFYLSLHQKWFKNKVTDIKAIVDVLLIYPFIYRNDGQPLNKKDLETFLLKHDLTEIICLKRPWPLLQRVLHQFLGILERVLRKL